MHYHPLNADKLDCRQFKWRLDAVLDERQQPEQDSQLRTHARHCPDCAAWMREQTSALSALESLADANCPPDLAFRVVQSFAAQRRHPALWRRWAVAALSVAAGLLLLVLIWRNGDIERRQPHMPITTQSPLPAYELLAREADNWKTKQLGVVGEVAHGFKPVTSSVYTALNNLWRALPGSESAQRTL